MYKFVYSYVSQDETPFFIPNIKSCEVVVRVGIELTHHIVWQPDGSKYRLKVYSV